MRIDLIQRGLAFFSVSKFYNQTDLLYVAFIICTLRSDCEGGRIYILVGDPPKRVGLYTDFLINGWCSSTFFFETF